jgi:hypothetical protein
MFLSTSCVSAAGVSKINQDKTGKEKEFLKHQHSHTGRNKFTKKHRKEQQKRHVTSDSGLEEKWLSGE